MLSANYRFHGHHSLSFLFRQGKTVRKKALSLKYAHNLRRKDSRVAVVVGRKVTKVAPKRNRIRRRVYEVVRVHWPELQAPYDMAFFVYDEAVAEMDFAELEGLILQLLEEAGIKNQGTIA